MKMSKQNREMLALIELMAECHDADLSEGKVAMMELDLRKYTTEEINAAWTAYRARPANLKMPTAAQLRGYLQDGHPSVNEAFSMLPKGEDESVVWSEEMRTAWSNAAAMIEGGTASSAFFAFKDAYEQAVDEARLAGRRPRWSCSFGRDHSGREQAVLRAIEKKRINLETASSMLPEIEYNPSFVRMLGAGAKNVLQIDHKGVAKISEAIAQANLKKEEPIPQIEWKPLTPDPPMDPERRRMIEEQFKKIGVPSNLLGEEK